MLTAVEALIAACRTRAEQTATENANHCKDCGAANPAMFMVHNELWASVGLLSKDFIYLPCFEQRLGRKVTLADLKICQLTEEMALGAQVALRALVTFQP